MKVAVMLTGRIKAWQDASDPCMANWFSKMDCTFFASVYGDPEDVAEFAKYYNITPDRLNVEEFNIPNPEHHIWKNDAFPKKHYRYGSMFYHIKKAYELVKNYKTDFECVIRWRPDFIITFNDFIQPPTEDVIYIPRSPGHYETMPNTWVPDQGAYGTMKMMEIYSGTYDNINDFGLNIPENTLFKQLAAHNTPWVWTDCLIQYTANDKRFDSTRD